MSRSRSYLSGVSPEQDSVHGEVRGQIELDACVVREHSETNRVPAGNRLPLGIDPDIQVIEEQVVVRAISAVLSAQKIRACRRPLGRRRRCRNRWSWRRLSLLTADVRGPKGKTHGDRQSGLRGDSTWRHSIDHAPTGGARVRQSGEGGLTLQLACVGWLRLTTQPEKKAAHPVFRIPAAMPLTVTTNASCSRGSWSPWRRRRTTSICTRLIGST